MTKRLLAAATAALLCSTAYSAETRLGPYFGITLGQADITRALDEETDWKSNDFTWGAQVGWQLHKFVSVEAGYLRPKTFHIFAIDPDTGERLFEEFDRVHGWTASALLSFPLHERVSIYGRIGGIRATGKYTVYVENEFLERLRVSRTKDTENELLFGGGFEMNIEGAKVRLDYQRAEFDNGEEIGLYSLGVNWFFPAR